MLRLGRGTSKQLQLDVPSVFLVLFFSLCQFKATIDDRCSACLSAHMSDLKPDNVYMYTSYLKCYQTFAKYLLPATALSRR